MVPRFGHDRACPAPIGALRGARQFITNRSLGTKIYVGNLDFKTTEDALRAAFAANGRTVKGNRPAKCIWLRAS